MSEKARPGGQSLGISLGGAYSKVSERELLAQGIDVDAVQSSAKAGISVGYQLTKPKTGLVATLFPSDANWHPLYNHNYAEITENMIALEATVTNKEKKEQKMEEVGRIVRRSYMVKTGSVVQDDPSVTTTDTTEVACHQKLPNLLHTADLMRTYLEDAGIGCMDTPVDSVGRKI